MTSDFTGGPGFAGFVATFVMVVAAVLLFRSMGKHLRKVRTHPPDDEPPAAPEGDALSGSPEGDAPSGSPEDGEGGGDVVADEPGDR